MARSSRPLLLLLVLPGAAVGLSGCAGDPVSTPASAASPAKAAGGAKPVGVVVATAGEVRRTITQPATIQGIEEASVYARASGYLKAVYVDKGDRVRAGQLLAVIESPELLFQQQQARSAMHQAAATATGVQAARGRAEADVTQADAAIERARSDARQAEVTVERAKADLARAQAQLPKLQARVAEARAAAQGAEEAHGQAQAEASRAEQQVRNAQDAVRTAEASLRRAETEARFQQRTYERMKAIQDRDAGLVPAQDVDLARTKMEAAKDDVEAARAKVAVAKGEVASAEQQLSAARRQVGAASRKVEAARSSIQAAHEEVNVGEREVDVARKQVEVQQASAESSARQVRVVEAQRGAMAAQVKVAAAQSQAAREVTAGSRSALAATSALAGYTRVVAPFDGVVTERLADPGAFMQNAGSNQAAARPVVRIIRDGSLRISLPVPEKEIPWVRRGQPVTITADAYPKQEFTGSVTRFATAVEARSRTMLVEVQVPNPGGKLRPGMYARVKLVLETHQGAVSVPSETVMGKEAERFVYAIVDGRAKKTPVTVGVDDGKMAEITSGVDAGTQVVLVGRDTLVDGAEVKAELVEPDAKK